MIGEDWDEFSTANLINLGYPFQDVPLKNMIENI